MPVRIVAVREVTKAISSPIRNAYIDFSKMTASLVAVAVGTIDMAAWDAVAKIADVPLFRLIAERHGRVADPAVFVYAAGGYYYPGKDDLAA